MNEGHYEEDKGYQILRENCGSMEFWKKGKNEPRRLKRAPCEAFRSSGPLPEASWLESTIDSLEPT